MPHVSGKGGDERAGLSYTHNPRGHSASSHQHAIYYCACLPYVNEPTL